jgi:hypothetical protein
MIVTVMWEPGGTGRGDPVHLACYACVKRIEERADGDIVLHFGQGSIDDDDPDWDEKVLVRSELVSLAAQRELP